MFKKFEPWMFVAMEEKGYTTTNRGIIQRLANYIVDNKLYDIEQDLFEQVCIECNIDPSSITQDDLNMLMDILNINNKLSIFLASFYF